MARRPMAIPAAYQRRVEEEEGSSGPIIYSTRPPLFRRDPQHVPKATGPGSDQGWSWNFRPSGLRACPASAAGQMSSRDDQPPPTAVNRRQPPQSQDQLP